MDKEQQSYDRIAKHYDFLSRLVFFKSQIRAQTEQLDYIENCKNLLIVGGGTGWILKDLNSIIQPINITFVETSIRMIELAKDVKTHHQVEFIHQDIENFNAIISFDAVLTPFLFDNFDDAKAEKVFLQIDKLLGSEAFWLYTDFKLDGKWWKHLLLKSMHNFFSLFKVVKVNTLPTLGLLFKNKGYKLKREKLYYYEFIEGKVYQKV